MPLWVLFQYVYEFKKFIQRDGVGIVGVDLQIKLPNSLNVSPFVHVGYLHKVCEGLLVHTL